MIHLHWDDEGCPRVEHGDMPSVIVGYLEQDVQSYTDTCDIVLRIIDDIAEGRRAEWEGSGNAHSVTARRDCVYIENLFFEDDHGVLSLADFRECILRWRSFVVEKNTAT